MAKKRKSVESRLDEVDRSLYSSFCSAANSLSELYTQAMNHQRLSFQAGERSHPHPCPPVPILLLQIPPSPLSLVPPPEPDTPGHAVTTARRASRTDPDTLGLRAEGGGGLATRTTKLGGTAAQSSGGEAIRGERYWGATVGRGRNAARRSSELVG
ncbi:hypothetical protein NL676_035260 [Syzygium grande]|nr:hypothetical protein NL676_035260 [Syzygium grande]